MVGSISSWKRSFAIAVKNTAPIMISFFIIGVAYGVLMESKGYAFPWPMIMSAVCFCGSMQFVAISLLTIAFDPLQAFALSLLVNARHCFYSISMLKRYSGTGILKPFLIFMLCDECFTVNSLVTPPEGVEKGHFYFAHALIIYLSWVISTALGSVADKLIFFNTKGMDFALTALFIVMLVNQCRFPENRKPAALGLTVTGLCLGLFGSENFILPAMAIILGVLFLHWRMRWS